MHFGRSPFSRAHAKRAKKSFTDFKFSTLFSRFPSDGADIMAVKGLNSLGWGVGWIWFV